MKSTNKRMTRPQRIGYLDPVQTDISRVKIQCLIFVLFFGVYKMNLFSLRFTPGMENATHLMATGHHPGKPSRVGWEMGWRSCQISSRMNICPSGERQVRLRTICLFSGLWLRCIYSSPLLAAHIVKYCESVFFNKIYNHGSVLALWNPNSINPCHFICM